MNINSAAELPAYTKRSVSARSVLTANIHCVVGTSGAVITSGSTTSDNVDITITINGTTGIYDIAFPPCLAVRPSVSIVYASSTTILAFGSAAPSASAGTWQVKFATEAGAGAWPASTDQFDIHLEFETEPTDA